MDRSFHQSSSSSRPPQPPGGSSSEATSSPASSSSSSSSRLPPQQQPQVYSRFTEAREADYDFLDFDKDVIETESASVDIPLPATNMGYKLALKMGWIEGKGLGKNGKGFLFLSFFSLPFHRHHHLLFS